MREEKGEQSRKEPTARDAPNEGQNLAARSEEPLAIYLVHPTFAPFGVSPALPLRFQKPSCGKKIVTSVLLFAKPPRIPAR